MTYARLDAIMGTRMTRKLANNTYGVRLDRCIEVTLHGHPIVRWYPAADYLPAHCTLHTCGFYSCLTKERLNSYGPDRLRLVQHDYVWYVGDGVAFRDNGTYYETCI